MKRWIETYTHRKLDVFDSDPDDICIEDIAHALSMICRFSGHISDFYSVAQHSVILTSIFEKDKTKDFDNSSSIEYQRQALLHDTAEAYLGDIPTPIKQNLTEYKEIENNLLEAIFGRFNVRYKIYAIVDLRDKQLCLFEARQFGKNVDDWTGYEKENIGRWPDKDGVIIPWNHRQAEGAFLKAFKELFI